MRSCVRVTLPHPKKMNLRCIFSPRYSLLVDRLAQNASYVNTVCQVSSRAFSNSRIAPKSAIRSMLMVCCKRQKGIIAHKLVNAYHNIMPQTRMMYAYRFVVLWNSWRDLIVISDRKIPRGYQISYWLIRRIFYEGQTVVLNRWTFEGEISSPYIFSAG